MVKLLRDKGYHRLNRFFRRWKFWIIITVPIVFTPLIILTHFDKAACCAYCTIIIMLYWVFDVIPLAITSLLPVFLFPIFDILDSERTSQAYMKDVNMLLFGGMAAAVAVEYCGLHRRIALKSLGILGTTPRLLMFGLMLPTVFLSMWINNTSATAMMTPIADQVLTELYPFDAVGEEEPTEEEFEADPALKKMYKEARSLRHGLMLCISYGACIGGSSTLTGTGTNLVMVQNIETWYLHGEVNVTYLNWMLFAVPNMILCVLALWLFIQLIFLGCRATCKCTKGVTEEQARLKDIIKKNYDELGPMTYHEKTILILFVILVLLWIFRDPGFMPGWKELFYTNVKIKDSAASTVVIVLMFLLPEYPDWWLSKIKDRRRDMRPPTAMTWRVIHARMGWGILILMGGGFAIAEGCQASGLCQWLGDSLRFLEGVPAPVITMWVMLLAMFLTSFTSNTATSNMLSPILLALADSIKVHPMLLLLPATLSASFAFIFPISTPPNAIVYGRAKISIGKMALVGTILCLVCGVITFIMVIAIAPLIFEMSEVPTPAKDHY